MISRARSRASVAPVSEFELDDNLVDGINEQKPLRLEVLEAVKSTADRSSIHGFPSFASASLRWPVKVVWLICVGASWGFFIYQINNSIILYNSYSVVSSTSIVYEAPTDFFGEFSE